MSINLADFAKLLDFSDFSDSLASPHLTFTTVNGVHEEFLLSFYNTVEKEYGDMASFFEKGLGITADDRAALQQMYLD